MKNPDSSHVPDFAPGDMSTDTARVHFERGAAPTIERNRMFLITCLLALGNLAQGAGYAFLLPLKTVETQIVRHVDGGRLVAEGAAVGNWTPDKDEISYFINQWANKVFDINAATIRGTLRESSEITIGNATAQLTEMRAKENPLILLKNSPNLIRTYEYESINFVQDNVAFLRFKTTTRYNGDVKVASYAMTITFTRVKPTTREQIMRNPAGLFISSFHITEALKDNQQK